MRQFERILNDSDWPPTVPRYFVVLWSTLADPNKPKKVWTILPATAFAIGALKFLKSTQVPTWGWVTRFGANQESIACLSAAVGDASFTHTLTILRRQDAVRRLWSTCPGLFLVPRRAEI